MFEGFRRFYNDPTGGSDRNAVDYFLLVGFILVSIVLWKLALRHILAD